MPSTDFRLRTRRLVLRPVTTGDRDALLALRNHPRVQATTSTGVAMEPERMQHQLERWVELWATLGVGTWLVELNGAAIAFVAIDPLGEGYPGVDPASLELGAVVHPDHWGSGIAAEAGVAAALDCFDRLGLPHVYATVDTTNDKSLALIAKVPGARLVSADDDELVYELPNPASVRDGGGQPPE